MNIAVKRFLAGCLRIANNVLDALPNRDGTPRPLTEAERAGLKNPSRPNIPFRKLNHTVPYADFARIFHLAGTMGDSHYYEAPMSVGRQMRTMAGSPPTQLDEQHGIGPTAVWNNPGVNIYVNIMGSSPMATVDGFIATTWNTLRNLPVALIHARKLEDIGGQAARHELPGEKCSIIIMGRTANGTNSPRTPIFMFCADYIDGDRNGDVTLRAVFAPVATRDGNNTILTATPISKRDDSAAVEILRTLIFCKLITDQMAQGKAADIEACLEAVRQLPLDDTSRLKDYLTWQPERGPHP